MSRLRTFDLVGFGIGLAFALLGIALPELGTPRWLAIVFFVAALLILGAIGGLVGLRYVSAIHPVDAGSTAAPTAEQLAAAHSPLRYRDDRLDTADAMDRFVGELRAWAEVRRVGPSAETQGGLGTLAKLRREHPDEYEQRVLEWEARNKTMRLEYAIAHRETAARLFDAAHRDGVISIKPREAVVRPDGLELDNLPDLFERLAERLRKRARDAASSQG